MARTAGIGSIKIQIDKWVSRIDTAQKVLEDGPPALLKLRAEFKSRASKSTVQAEIDRLAAESARMVALLAEVPEDADTADSEDSEDAIDAELAEMAEETVEDFDNETESESV